MEIIACIKMLIEKKLDCLHINAKCLESQQAALNGSSVGMRVLCIDAHASREPVRVAVNQFRAQS